MLLSSTSFRRLERPPSVLHRTRNRKKRLAHPAWIYTRVPFSYIHTRSIKFRARTTCSHTRPHGQNRQNKTGTTTDSPPRAPARTRQPTYGLSHSTRCRLPSSLGTGVLTKGLRQISKEYGLSPDSPTWSLLTAGGQAPVLAHAVDDPPCFKAYNPPPPNDLITLPHPAAPLPSSATKAAAVES